MAGLETLAAQGLEFEEEALSETTDNLMSDLAGNAFSSSVFMSALVPPLTCMRYGTRTETTENEDANAMMAMSLPWAFSYTSLITHKPRPRLDTVM